MSIHQFPRQPGLGSYQDPKLTPRDFWEREPRIPDLLDVMDEYERDALAVMLQDLTEAQAYGRDCTEIANDLAQWLRQLDMQKRKTASR